DALRAFENPSWLRADAAQGTFGGTRRIPFSRYRAEPQNSRVAHPWAATNPQACSVRLNRHSSSPRSRWARIAGTPTDPEKFNPERHFSTASANTRHPNICELDLEGTSFWEHGFGADHQPKLVFRTLPCQSRGRFELLTRARKDRRLVGVRVLK